VRLGKCDSLADAAEESISGNNASAFSGREIAQSLHAPFRIKAKTVAFTFCGNAAHASMTIAKSGSINALSAPSAPHFAPLWCTFSRFPRDFEEVRVLSSPFENKAFF
jgi:hypothetical protein